MINIRGLVKSFDGRRVLDGVNLQVRHGETMVVLGTSGCGKSVLLKHLIGLLKPEEGEILIDGLDITKLRGRALDDVRGRFGMVFQGGALFDSMTVWENVSFILRERQGLPAREARSIASEKLAMVGLEGFEDVMPAQLSGGMRKRVALARAVAAGPSIVLYDEPTTGVDPIMADIINDLIVELSRKLEVTSVAVTHDMASAYKIGDRLAMLYRGKVIEVGTPGEIQASANPVVRQFITGSARGPIMEGVHHGLNPVSGHS